MLIYEKDNKLNINFENSVEETPDLQISKENGKTSVTIDGQESGGGSGGGVEPVIVTVTETSETEGTWSGATWEELVNAYYHGCAFVMDDVNITPINGSLTIQDDTAIDMEFSNIFAGEDGVVMVTVTLSSDKSVVVNRSQYTP